MRLWKNIIHAAEKRFAEGAFIPSMSLETLESVRFAILTEVTN